MVSGNVFYLDGWFSVRLPSRRNEVITGSSELIDVTFVNPMIDFNYKLAGLKRFWSHPL